MAFIAVQRPSGEVILRVETASPITGGELLERIENSKELLEGCALTNRWKLLLQNDMIEVSSVLEGGSPDLPLLVTAILVHYTGPPPLLAITHTSRISWGTSYLKDYVGLWRHDPIEHKIDLFVQTHAPNDPNWENVDASEDPPCLFWQDDKYHWRTSHKSSADPTKPGYGCGTYYFKVPGGPEEKYSNYEIDGLTFTWNPTRAEQDAALQAEPASGCTSM
eukprot:TRINITY_DN61342_c0_g1_i1.p1 TRINITY_DN61342_c0_g1~~TRINITY_DN61342_c0_g1_i1.p1  ORF type:complete len:221 (-),score=31.36 TRINITY_DN61342_c0_g1_i1:253-915(-)